MVAQGSTQADTQICQVVHTAFRLATTRLVDAAEKLEPSELQREKFSAWVKPLLV